MHWRSTFVAGIALSLGLASGAAAQDVPRTSEATLIELPPADAAPLPDSVELPAGSIAYVTGADTTGSWTREHVIASGVDSALGKGFEVEWRPSPEDATVVAYTVRGADTAPPSSTIRQWSCVEGVCEDRTLVRHAWRPRWSPAGDAIAFSRSVIDLGDAWVRDFETERTTRLPGGEPEWSPTGEWLLVLKEDVDDLVVAAAVVRPDGSDERILGSGWNATWSPDGQRVASTWTEGRVTTVTAVDIGSRKTEELFALEGSIADMRWLPGDTLAFVRGDHDGGDVYAVDLADGSVTSLTAGLLVEPDLAVSPEGEWLAFSAVPTDAAVTGTTGIYLASRGGGWRPLVTGVDASLPDWRPDGAISSTSEGLTEVGLAWQRVRDPDLVSYPADTTGGRSRLGRVSSFDGLYLTVTRPVPVSGTPRWATRAWMTRAATLPDGVLVAVGTEPEGGEPSSAAWVSVPTGG